MYRLNRDKVQNLEKAFDSPEKDNKVKCGFYIENYHQKIIEAISENRKESKNQTVRKLLDQAIEDLMEETM